MRIEGFKFLCCVGKFVALFMFIFVSDDYIWIITLVIFKPVFIYTRFLEHTITITMYVQVKKSQCLLSKEMRKKI